MEALGRRQMTLGDEQGFRETQFPLSPSASHSDIDLEDRSSLKRDPVCMGTLVQGLWAICESEGKQY